MYTLDKVESIFTPTLSVQYCNYFYWLLIIYFILAAIQVVDFSYALITNVHNLGKFMRTNMIHRLTHLIMIVTQFVITRIAYTVCVKAMKQ